MGSLFKVYWITVLVTHVIIRKCNAVFCQNEKKCYGDEKFYKHFFLGDLELEDNTSEGLAISIVEFDDNTAYILPDRRYV